MQQEKLGLYDFVILLDSSSSMLDAAKKNEPNGLNRWQQAREITHGITRTAAKYDDDGATVLVFAGGIRQIFENVTDAVDKVDNVFTTLQPNGSTNTAAALKHVLDEYFAAKKKNPSETKPVILVVITDGEPNSEIELEQVIISATKKMTDADEIGISFLQAGDDAKAHAFLSRLDTGLGAKGAAFDIVNVHTFDEMDNLTAEEILTNVANS
jgi:Mg-chelatase subunit ChlD